MNSRSFVRLLICGTFVCSGSSIAEERALARLDLRTYGYQLNLANYSIVSFLSEDTLLVSINQQPGSADRSLSGMVVFDVSKGRVIKTGKMAVDWNCLQPISNERFAVINREGLHFCDSGLRCERLMPAQAPMLVSPKGTRIAIGGYQQTSTKIIDTKTLKQVAVFDFATGIGVRAIPGEDDVLLRRADHLFIESSGVREVLLNGDTKWVFPECRFLNGKLLGCLDHDASEAVIVDMDGRKVWHYKVAKPWRAGFITASVGKRFAIYEHGYTTLNSIENLLDIKDTRPENFQRVRVVDSASGAEISQFEWDPRPSLAIPALSPSGHRLARVKAGVLEVFGVD